MNISRTRHWTGRSELQNTEKTQWRTAWRVAPGSKYQRMTWGALTGAPRPEETKRIRDRIQALCLARRARPETSESRSWRSAWRSAPGLKLQRKHTGAFPGAPRQAHTVKQKSDFLPQSHQEKGRFCYFPINRPLGSQNSGQLQRKILLESLLVTFVLAFVSVQLVFTRVLRLKFWRARFVQVLLFL